MSLDWICAALGVPDRVPATEASEAAAANLVALLPERTWDHWPAEARSAARLALRYDAIALLTEIQDAVDSGELSAFLSGTPEVGDPQWDVLLAGRADRAEQAKHDEGLRTRAAAKALASTALKVLKRYATQHPEGPAGLRPDM